MSESQDRLGEILAAHRLGRDALVLLGWSGEPFTVQGTAVAVKRPTSKGRFAAGSWFDEGQKRHWFLIVVHAPESGTCQAGDGFQLQGSGAEAATVAYCPATVLGSVAFGKELSSRLGQRIGDAVDFLVSLFAAVSVATAEPLRGLVLATLEATADERGMVEVLGRLRGKGLLLAGWMRDWSGGELRLLIDNGSLQECAANLATYARPDVPAPALGFVAVARATDSEGLAAAQQIYARTGDGYHRLTVQPSAIRLRDEEVEGYLSGLMARLPADAAKQNPAPSPSPSKFDGRDTVSALPVPVRMAVDMAACLPGAGWYVTGWLLDPLDLVASVTMRGPNGLSQRLDATWTRLAREDVSNEMRGEALFAGRVSHDKHGFTVFVPGEAADTKAWIELDVANRGPAFLPIAVTALGSFEGRKRLLSSVDLHKAAALDIIERQLGPLFHARKPVSRKSRDTRSIRAGGEGGHTALIVPIVEDDIKTKIVVSHLASSRLPAGVRLVFVCSASLPEIIPPLRRDLDFYGLTADVLVAGEPVDRCEAIEIGVDATTEPRLVFLAPQVHGTNRQWLVDLIAALGDSTQPTAVSPTLLYEDGSIRYAGIDSIEFRDTPPYTTVVGPRAGYPRGAAAHGAGGPTFAGALDCCAMTRSAFQTTGGFGAGYVLEGFKGLDLFLRLRKAGVPMSWAGEIEVYAPDDRQSAGGHWAAVGALADGWAFKAAWQAGLSSRHEHPQAGPAISLSDRVQLRRRAAAG